VFESVVVTEEVFVVLGELLEGIIEVIDVDFVLQDAITKDNVNRQPNSMHATFSFIFPLLFRIIRIV
jgi:hypothetical protein